MVFGHSRYNKNIYKYNEGLENVPTVLSGVFDFDLVFFNDILEMKDISNDGVHLSISHGIPKLGRNVQNFYVHQGLRASETEKNINRNFGKNL